MSESKSKIRVSTPAAALRFLSPIQLETLLFKLLNDNQLMVTSHRGGSKYKIDLYVKSGNTKTRLPYFKTSEDIRIQVKRTIKDEDLQTITKEYLEKSIYFFTLDDPEGKYAQISKHEYFIGRSKHDSLLAAPESQTVIPWIQAVLGNSCFDFDF